MSDFDKKQIERLRGSLQRIAEKVGCSREYVSRVVNGHVESDTETTRKIVSMASQIIEILEPSEVNA